METGVQLDKMTTADKLRAMEEIWADLQRNPEDVPAPAWHGDVLRAREAREKEGISRFGEWTDAKARIREHTRGNGQYLGDSGLSSGTLKDSD